MKNYKVGQVIFVIDSEKNSVMPGRIIEEITKKTLEGDQIQYKVIFGVDPKNTVDLSTIKGEIYCSLHDVKKVLFENISKWVESQIQKTAKATMAWYKFDALSTIQQTEQKQVEVPELCMPSINYDEPIIPEEPMMIEIAPGQFAKVKSIGMGNKTSC